MQGKSQVRNTALPTFGHCVDSAQANWCVAGQDAAGHTHADSQAIEQPWASGPGWSGLRNICGEMHTHMNT